MTQVVIKLSDVSRYGSAGLPWHTRSQAEWAYRHRHTNGLQGCFAKVGRTVLILAHRYHELVGQLAN